MGISREQALDCFRSDDLVGLGMEADAVRRQLHPERVVGYAIESRIDCGAATGETFSNVLAAVANSVNCGATAIRLMNCGNLALSEAILSSIRQQHPTLWIAGFSETDLHTFAETSGLGLPATIARLVAAGLDTIASDAIRLLDGGLPVAEWCAVHRAAHALGMQTIASLTFGAGETVEQSVDFLTSTYQLQEETGGFAAFAPHASEAHGGRELDSATAVERLKTLAIARLFLKNIDTIQAVTTQQGLKVLQMGLRFGANDVGAVDPLNAGAEEDLRRIIRDAGFQPAERQFGYRAMSML